MSAKVHPLDKKIPAGFSVSRRTKIAFKQKCERYGLSASETIEALMLDFIKG